MEIRSAHLQFLNEYIICIFK